MPLTSKWQAKAEAAAAAAAPPPSRAHLRLGGAEQGADLVHGGVPLAQGLGLGDVAAGELLHEGTQVGVVVEGAQVLPGEACTGRSGAGRGSARQALLTSHPWSFLGHAVPAGSRHPASTHQRSPHPTH